MSNDIDYMEKEEIRFSDFIIKIDYGIKDLDDFGNRDYVYSTQRRCRLFDKEGNLIEEVIDDNPYERGIPEEVLKGEIHLNNKRFLKD
ncbi:MAG: hypothetical protein PUC09_03280 [Methanobrevibacter wolinii]|nr:hypothetical protein [Methanobrevibacter wolinii]